MHFDSDQVLLWEKIIRDIEKAWRVSVVVMACLLAIDEKVGIPIDTFEKEIDGIAFLLFGKPEGLFEDVIPAGKEGAVFAAGIVL